MSASEEIGCDELAEDLQDLSKINKKGGLDARQTNGYLYQIGFKDSGNLLRFDSGGTRCVVIKDDTLILLTTKGTRTYFYLTKEEWEYVSNCYTKGITIFVPATFMTCHMNNPPAIASGLRLKATYHSKDHLTHACILRVVNNQKWLWYDSMASDSDSRPADKRYLIMGAYILPAVRTGLGLTGREYPGAERAQVIRTMINDDCAMHTLYFIESFIRGHANYHLGFSVRLQYIYLYKLRRFLKYSGRVKSFWYTQTPVWNMDPLLSRMANGEHVSRMEIKARIQELESSDRKVNWKPRNALFVPIRSFRISSNK